MPAANAVERAPVTLLRVPLLARHDAECNAWSEVQRLLAQSARLEARLTTLTTWATARLDLSLQRNPPEWRLLVAVRRALQRGRVAPLNATGLSARLANAAVRARREHSAALARAAAAAPDAQLTWARTLMLQPCWANALMLASPDVATQAVRTLPGTCSSHRNRLLLRSITRFAWRAAGRTAPMGLFGHCTPLADDAPTAADPREIDVQIRCEALGIEGSPLITPEKAEAAAWDVATRNMAHLSRAVTISRLRELAQRIRAGDVPTLTRAEARALWVEQFSTRPEVDEPAALQPALAILCRFGSALESGTRRASCAALLPALGPSGMLPLTDFSALLEQALVARFGRPAVDALPLESLTGSTVPPLAALDEIVRNALSSSGCIASARLQRFGVLAAVPRRAAARLRADGRHMTLHHWGSDAMTVLNGQVVQRGPSLPPWYARWPGVDLALGACAAADRPQRMSTQQLSANRSAECNVHPDDVQVRWNGRSMTLWHRATVLPPVRHTGQRAEHGLPFLARVLLLLGEAVPTLLCSVLEALNRAQAARIGEWLAKPDSVRVLSLPGISVDDALVLAPPAFVIRAGASDWPSLCAHWLALMNAGCRLGLTELRMPGGALHEPRIIDLATPDGLSLALNSSSGLSHLTPLSPGLPCGRLAEVCVEVCAR